MLDIENYIDHFASNLTRDEGEDSDEDDFIWEGAYEVKIEHHMIQKETCQVSFRIKFKYGPETSWISAVAEELDLQKHYPSVVLNYWTKLGGRCQVTDFEKYHVYRIVSEKKRHYEIQWIGYGETDTSWEPKTKIKRICPAAIVEWKTRSMI
ncbi:hypothetical protein KAF25_003624 [Fusarium avenaceum]|uniref:Chromo domain-containing protein n=1 Tax=Fusarium avenaceum TaxID=40199 RepID=A0A9P7H8A3_9HYPO|nr:hypothetical protein KAF25_003624 [Fusarium avenaceum]